MKGRQALID